MIYCVLSEPYGQKIEVLGQSIAWPEPYVVRGIDNTRDVPMIKVGMVRIPIAADLRTDDIGTGMSRRREDKTGDYPELRFDVPQGACEAGNTPR